MILKETFRFKLGIIKEPIKISFHAFKPSELFFKKVKDILLLRYYSMSQYVTIISGAGFMLFTVTNRQIKIIEWQH